jgi:hypothetical protein
MSSDCDSKSSLENVAPVAPTEGRTSQEATLPQPDDPSRPRRCNLLILSFLSFFVIGFGVWLVSAGTRYRAEYAQAMEGWRVGSSRVVELTLVKEDKHNLACAADHSIEGLHCGYRINQHANRPNSPDDPLLLQPYNTVGNELLLGAGLWLSPGLQGSLPETRFTVICTYHIKGVMKSAAIRFDPSATFGPIGKTATVGTLTECTIPR